MAHCSAIQECLLPPEAADCNNLQSGLLLEARDTDISGLGGIGNINYMFAGVGGGVKGFPDFIFILQESRVKLDYTPDCTFLGHVESTFLD